MAVPTRARPSASTNLRPSRGKIPFRTGPLSLDDQPGLGSNTPDDLVVTYLEMLFSLSNSLLRSSYVFMPLPLPRLRAVGAMILPRAGRISLASLRAVPIYDGLVALKTPDPRRPKTRRRRLPHSDHELAELGPHGLADPRGAVPEVLE